MNRIPIIAQGLVEGWGQEEIADACGVTDRTIRRDMNTVEFETFFSKVRMQLLNVYLTKLAQLEKIGDKRDKKFVLSQHGLLVRKMMPTRIETTTEEVVRLVEPVFHPDLMDKEDEEE